MIIASTDDWQTNIGCWAWIAEPNDIADHNVRSCNGNGDIHSPRSKYIARLDIPFKDAISGGILAVDSAYLYRNAEGQHYLYYPTHDVERAVYDVNAVIKFFKTGKIINNRIDADDADVLNI